jgi:hypothetical protein
MLSPKAVTGLTVTPHGSPQVLQQQFDVKPLRAIISMAKRTR